MSDIPSGGLEIRAVILAAGKGTRLRPLTNDLSKAFVQIGDKTLVDVLVENYEAAGITSLTVGVGWQGDVLRSHLEERQSAMDIEVVDVPDYEDGPLRTLTTTLRTVEDETVIVGPVDQLMDDNLVSNALEQYHDKKSPEDIILLVDLSTKKGTQVFLDEAGLVVGLGTPLRDYDSTACSAMLMIISKSRYRTFIESANKGVPKVSEALNQLITEGAKVGHIPIEGTWFDIDTVHDILQVNRFVLRHMQESVNAPISIRLGDTMEFGQSIALPAEVFVECGVSLHGPVLVQENCKIAKNTIIGPDVVIAKGAEIGANCRIENTTLFKNAKIRKNTNIQDAVVFDSEVLYSEE
ncbi:MAG: NTP transferase domain-containing protein [Candidatus Lokiarchaeota archaeon]|nr:NTP transferase domain-containing protein [Candidatus Lokiarchaeota archaeon]